MGSDAPICPIQTAGWLANPDGADSDIRCDGSRCAWWVLQPTAPNYGWCQVGGGGDAFPDPAKGPDDAGEEE